jgi:hypothetical protein
MHRFKSGRRLENRELSRFFFAWARSWRHFATKNILFMMVRKSLEEGMRHWRRNALVLMLFLVASVLSSGAADEARVVTIDKVICAVDNYAITLEQIEVEKAVLAHSKDCLLFPGQETQLNTEKVLQELVARRLLLSSALRMGFSTVEQKAVDEEMDRFRKAFGAPATYNKFLRRYQLVDKEAPGLDAARNIVENGQEIDYRFKNILIVRRFVNKKLELQVRLAMEQKKAEGGAAAPPGQTAAMPETGSAEQQIYLEKLHEWIRTLAERAKITILDEEYWDEVESLLLDSVEFNNRKALRQSREHGDTK